ncbi:MAG: glycosyl hydrolase [Isosphaeraceae bacterium]|jgi:putative membrane-bound dehydrogenase-like protein|nr:MAG: glycosyl hydrolase [Isosphaeraceae bacterium]
MANFARCPHLLLTLLALTTAAPADQGSQRIKTLFLGDNGHHQPLRRLTELAPALAKAGIDVAYTDDLNDLNPSKLARYDALLIYANHERISPDQEQALLDFVEWGKGLVVLHCGSYCFLNSPRYIALVGGQFQSHETASFTARIVRPDHPAMTGVEEFEAFDETYVHTKLSDDRVVLMEREAEDGRREPWTWVRTQGRGRVFYTASGHDERVFTHPGFHRLVIAGIRWAAGDRPAFKPAELTYQDGVADIPNYVRSNRWGTQGKPFKRMQNPLDPEASSTHLSVPGGFRAELFAAEPQIVKPIALTWDHRGRLLVAESVDYPNDKQPEGQGNDRITICEDTDGDHRADRFTVFADKLSIPTSLVMTPAGLIVAQAPEMLLLVDTDGDDRADVRKVLFSGFHIDDTHAGPSNLRLGFDGWIYATVGYAGFEGTVGGEHHQFRQNIFRFRPDGSKLEVLGSTSNNTWGLGITETNEIVYSTANGEHSSYLGHPNRSFEAVRGWLGQATARMADHDRFHPLTTVRQVDFFGGFTAAAGHAVYTARHFPPEYWNRYAFVAEPTGHLVHQMRLDRRGSHMVSRDRFNLLASTDEWTSPIAAEVGPDGAVWVLDWYNFIVQHNPTPLGFTTGKGNAYETPLRDKTHGRVYRVCANDRPLESIPGDLTRFTPAQLVEVLRHLNMFWRMAAQWHLVARGDRRIVADLTRLIAASEVEPETGENPAALHALWTLQGLKALDQPPIRDAVTSALRSPAPSVRRAAAEVLPRDTAAAQAILTAGLLDDPHPVVRREALRVLSECPSSDQIGAAVVAALLKPENTEDRWIPLAATTAAARHDLGFLAAALKSDQPTDALTQTARIVAEHAARGPERGRLPAVLAAGFEQPGPCADAILAGLSAGWPDAQIPALDDATRKALLARLDSLSPTAQLSLALLARRWGLASEVEGVLASLRSRLADEVADESLPEAQRIGAARRLAQLDPDRDTLERLVAAISPRTSPPLAAGLLAAIGSTSSDAVAEILLSRWDQLTPALRSQTVELLLRRPEWTKALVEAIAADTIPATDLAIDQTQRLAAHPDAAIADRVREVLARGGRLPSPDRQEVLNALLPVTQVTGDAANGRLVFEKNCAKCHRHGDLGENIGPNLTGFAIHPKEKILTEIIDPNRSVEGNFRQYTVALTDGQVLSGLLASETRTAIELVDGEAKRHTILREEIEEMIASPRSVMPEGFEKQMSEAEFADLLEFLTAKGKFVPLPIDKVATIVTTQGMFYDKQNRQERLVLPDWSAQTVADVPFLLVDPRGDRVPNAIMLQSTNGDVSRTMPTRVSVPCNAPARAIHLLSGISGWGFPATPKGSTSLVVRLHYADGQTEDHRLINGEHFADYIREVDVPGSKLAFKLRGGQQVRYLAIQPRREAPIREIEFLKGDDTTAPIVLAITLESP